MIGSCLMDLGPTIIILHQFCGHSLGGSIRISNKIFGHRTSRNTSETPLFVDLIPISAITRTLFLARSSAITSGHRECI